MISNTRMNTNWCSNKLTVSGKTGDVKRFVENAAGIYVRRDDEGRNSSLCFDKVVPLPQSATFLDEIADWGCKWGAFKVVHSVSPPTAAESVAEFSFKTPWTPPVELMNRVAETFKLLRFSLSFKEHSGKYDGKMEWAAGKKLFDQTTGKLG